MKITIFIFPKGAGGLCFALLAAAMLLGACKKAPEYRRKTQQERTESYRRELTTPDLRLFGLRGTVREAEIEATAFLRGESGARAATLFVQFMPNGLLKAAILCGDSLTLVRNNEGDLLRLSTAEDYDIMPLLRATPPQPQNIEYY